MTAADARALIAEERAKHSHRIYEYDEGDEPVSVRRENGCTTCGDVDGFPCEARKSIDRLATALESALDRIGVLEMWLCPHPKRLDGQQCADCAGIIHDPERIALERAELAEDALRHFAFDLGPLTVSELVDGVSESKAELLIAWRNNALALLADLDARGQS